MNRDLTVIRPAIVHPVQGDSRPINAALLYYPDDPYAVHLRCHTDDEDPITWSFARDLLDTGAREPTGLGDIHIGPTPTNPRTALLLRLSSPDGAALLRIDLDVVRWFLDTTWHLVPTGTEGSYLDLDTTIDQLLAET